MEIPTRERFVAACRDSGLYSDMPDEDLNKMYDLLVGPPEDFMKALNEWHDSFSKTLNDK